MAQDEPNQPASSTPLQASVDLTPYRRAMVFRGAGDQKSPLVRMTLIVDDAGHGNLQLQGDAQDEIENIRAIIEGMPQTPISQDIPSEDPKERKWTRLVDALEQEGLVVEILPAGDHEVNFELDLLSGHGIGNFSSLHSYATPDDALGRNIVSSMTR